MDIELNVIATSSADETRHIGAMLAQVLQPGDVVLLSGDLGAGKTQLVQGVAAGLGANEVPTSPTFNIVLSYESGRLPLHHFDLYRLEAEKDLEDIGLAEYLESGGVCFVEWAEKFPGAFDEWLSIDIAKGSDDARELRISCHGARGEAIARAWADACREGIGEGSTGTDSRLVARSESMAQPIDGGPVLPSTGSMTSFGAVESEDPVVLAFDTANEVVAIGVGALVESGRHVEPIAMREVQAHRASNTTLLPEIDALLHRSGIGRERIACVCVGRGPGSFTGVRIAMATAKGVASALGVGLVGVSSLDAIAWSAQADGLRGRALVVADAMRKEVYPVFYELSDAGALRQTADRVVKAVAFSDELAEATGGDGESATAVSGNLHILGDALVKYRDLYEGCGIVADESLWAVSGRGLMLALQAAWRAGDADPFDVARHDPAFTLPVYTRLSDAEENERARLARAVEKNLLTGVQDVEHAPDGGVGRATMHVQSLLVAPPREDGISYRPLDARDAASVAALEARAMGSDAWGDRLVADELNQRMRTWWVAEADGMLVGYAGGMVVDGDMQVLKVAVETPFRRRGVARELLSRIAADARDLGAKTCSLEVRASNEGAQAFYESLGLSSIGTRPRYYSDREDAVIMQGPLPVALRGVAGMELKHLDTVGHVLEGGRFSEVGEAGVQAGADADDACGCNGVHGNDVFASDARGAAGSVSHAMPNARNVHGIAPLILAIESSCDETAAAVVDGSGELLSDVVASQIDFHARFGGVVPEIASRKHIEAICGVCEEALAVAGERAAAVAGFDARRPLAWRDLDAVAVTYAPGLVGALVVGVAFAKGVAWALDIPFIGVNHLEGHLYANKVGAEGFEPPAVVSLVSGGNTMLVHMRGWGDYITLGTTIDDAVGEAFDKVSKALGLGYPGGPVISRYAAQGNPAAIDFPRAMMHSHDLRFSLSGLKTAVVNYINSERQAGREPNVADIAASFQQAVVDVQVAKAKDALKLTGARTFCLGGGVAANPVLRSAYEDLCARMGVRLVMPPLSSCGDNAGMIALVALDRYRAGRFFDLSADAYAHADLDEPY